MTNMKLSGMILMLFMFAFSAEAHIDPNKDYNKPKGTAANSIFGNRADCSPGEAQIDMDINNVRARLLSGGDVWWDLQDGLYVVPKPAEGQDPVSSIFAGGVWIGGVDPSGNLKLAGVTYRNGNSTDFYTGPLDELGGTDKPICEEWDQFFVVNGDDVLRHIAAYDADPANYDCDSIPESVYYWPGKNNINFEEEYGFELPKDQALGAFWDEDFDGNYDPCEGDFPMIDIRGCAPDNRKEAKELVPDQMIFWVYNDAGGPHRLSFATPIQMEVQVQAFAYATNDEINDMTFQRYKLINKATTDIRDCYFAMWVDPDLGCYNDDYIGCDVERSLAYVYNEDDVDGQNDASCPGGVNTYGTEIPILGVDYFRGPRGPKVFCYDADGNVIRDTIFFQRDSILGGILYLEGDTLVHGRICGDPEFGSNQADTLVELGMTSFIYNENAGVGSPPDGTTDPDNAEEFYNYLRGIWKDGLPLTMGNSGYNPESTDITRYAFTGEPDDPNGWSMCTANLEFGDRRTIQATGPLLLQPGATNELIIGVVWVPNINYPCPDISQLQFADGIAQSLFDNCFDITDGPDAPDLCAIELDKEFIIALTNDENTSNNRFEQYSEIDLQAPQGTEDNLYRFEGYKIYQLINSAVSPQELDDIEKARLVRQVDVKNGVGEIFNWSSEANPLGGPPIWTPTREVAGTDEGLRHTFRILEDAFASGDTRLVNHKAYYYTVVAYAYNNYQPFNILDGQGQRRAYLEGRRNVKTYKLVPRPIVYEKLNAEYGDGPAITRLQGQGVGSNFVDLADGMHDKILDGSFDGSLEYKPGAGPLSVNIFDPFSVQPNDYKLEIIGEFNGSNKVCALEEGATWQLTDLTTNEIVASEKTLDEINEQIIFDKGFTITLSQAGEPGTGFDPTNGAISATLEYADETGERWFNGITDGGRYSDLFLNPIVSGLLDHVINNDPVDPDNQFTSIDNGYFTPFYLSRSTDPDEDAIIPWYITTGWRDNKGHIYMKSESVDLLRFEDLNNVDIVFTSDKSKWSRCVVVEAATNDHRNFGGFDSEGSATRFELRKTDSVDKDGNPDGDGIGMSYFPGYAIDVETGKRLNIFFAENSIYNENLAPLIDGNVPIGGDMIFNPSSQLVVTSQSVDNTPTAFIAGGQHYIYVTRQEYDGCESMRDGLSSSLFFNKVNPLSFVTWTAFPMLTPGTALNSLDEGLIPNDLTVKLRVANPYGEERFTDIDKPVNCFTIEGLPQYTFSMAGFGKEDLTQQEYEGALANVNIVPNPYYAYSTYETSQFTTTVKITNLPALATVTIYTLDGKFIRQFRRDERGVIKGGNNPAVRQGQVFPDVEWDLKNSSGIPIASGVYIFHVEAPELGEERALKWFGVNRRFDPTGL